MENSFITNIHIGRVRHLHNIDIELSSSERKHLIFTGKNGSGKTSMLEALRDSVLFEQKGIPPDGTKLLTVSTLKKPDIILNYSQEIIDFANYTFVFISARLGEFILPKTIEKAETTYKANISKNLSNEFLKYILRLDYRLYGALNDNKKELEINIKNWFDNLTTALCNIYDCKELKLQRDTDNLAFKILLPGREPFALHEMSDGYAAILVILAELLMRFEHNDACVDYNQPAIVFIDEIEAHLHVELQKRVLPFLTQMFPHVQFIVSTHSPFIINSLANSVVYDLEKGERIENPSIFSYEALVEGFLDVGQYSNETRNKFNRYKELYNKNLSKDEIAELNKLILDLEMIPPASKELYYAFRSMEDKRKK